MNNELYASDIRKVAQAALLNGHCITYEKARECWENYSDSMCAGWMMLPESTDDIWNCISGQFSEQKEIVESELIKESCTIVQVLKELKEWALQEYQQVMKDRPDKETDSMCFYQANGEAYILQTYLPAELDRLIKLYEETFKDIKE